MRLIISILNIKSTNDNTHVDEYTMNKTSYLLVNTYKTVSNAIETSLDITTMRYNNSFISKDEYMNALEELFQKSITNAVNTAELCGSLKMSHETIESILLEINETTKKIESELYNRVW